MINYTRMITSRGFFNPKKKPIEPHLKPVEGEVRLFRTVLDKAVLDLLIEPKTSPLYKDTFSWFFDDTMERELRLITDLAFFEVEDVRKKVSLILENIT